MSGTQAIAGGLAGLVSFVATYPIQLASTRKQIEAKEKGKSQYGSPLATILKILQDEGISALYSGLKRYFKIGSHLKDILNFHYFHILFYFILFILFLLFYFIII